MYSLEKEIENLKEEAKVNEKKIDRILSYLENDATTGKKGLVAEVAQMKIDHARVESKLDIFIEDFKKKEAVTTAIKNTKTAFWGIIGAVFAWLIKEIASKIFTHL